MQSSPAAATTSAQEEAAPADAAPAARCLCACACVCICDPPCFPLPADSSLPPPYCVRASWRRAGAHSELDEAFATYPCKIIHTRRAGQRATHSGGRAAHNGVLPAMPMAGPAASAACVYVTSYGGGLFPGDCVRMRLHAHVGATAQVASQGFNKVHAADPHAQRQRRDAATASAQQAAMPSVRPDAFCSQSIDAHVAPDALLLWLPEPTMIYSGASFRSNSIVELQCESPAATGSVVWLDWLYAGRTARGEVFDFASYHNRTHVHAKIQNRDGGDEIVPIILEALRLEQTTGTADGGVDKGPAAPTAQGAPSPSSLAVRLSPYHSYVSVLLLGPRVASLAAAIHTHVSRSRVDAVPSSRHGRGGGGGANGSAAAAAAASKMPRVMFSSQWIDVPLEGQHHATDAASSPSSSTCGPSLGRLTGCYLRVSSVSLEESACVLRAYLSSLDAVASVPTPWQMLQ